MDARLEQAFALHREGRLAEARTLCEAILQEAPTDAGALHLLGVVALIEGRQEEGLAFIDRAIAADPQSTHFQATHFHANRGRALQRMGRHEEAAQSLARAVALDPRDPGLHVEYGGACLRLGQLDAALGAHQRALALDPSSAGAWSGCAQVFLQGGDAVRALECIDRALALQPGRADRLINRGVALRMLGRTEEALHAFEVAIAGEPQSAIAHSNRGNALRELGRPEEAIECHRRALEIDPRCPDANYNMGVAQQELVLLDEALASYERELALVPGHAKAIWNKALLLLARRDFAQGWRLYEQGFGPGRRGDRRQFRQPQWDGREPLRGRTILLHAEQGLGDAIQFVRYAKLVAEQGAHVLLGVPRSLATLVTGVAGVHQVVAYGEPVPPFDLHCPLLSLPLALAAGPLGFDIPAEPAYLHADAGKAREWEQRLGPRRALRVGIVWSGNPSHGNDRNRSVALESFLAALPPGLDLVSLQKDVRERDLAALARVRHFGDQLHDFAETAALCSLMDVVVSVDTSVAHLAAALGRPTWILVPDPPDWRWQLDRTDSPWYPSVRLYRRIASRDWGPVLARVGRDLAALAST